MPYAPDLGDDLPYGYLQRDPEPERPLTVGWLAKEHPFPRGEVPAEFVRALHELCRDPVNMTRGFQVCEFCRDPVFFLTPVPHEEGEYLVGSAEIHVPGEGCTYVAPNLIVHYVTEHAYLPPREFVDAVLKQASGPDPAGGSEDPR